MNFFQKFRDFLINPSHSRTLGLLGILTFVGIISLTVIVSQQQQQTRQHAAEKDFTTCFNENTSLDPTQDEINKAMVLCGIPTPVPVIITPISTASSDSPTSKSLANCTVTVSIDSNKAGSGPYEVHLYTKIDNTPTFLKTESNISSSNYSVSDLLPGEYVLYINGRKVKTNGATTTYILQTVESATAVCPVDTPKCSVNPTGHCEVCANSQEAPPPCSEIYIRNIAPTDQVNCGPGTASIMQCDLLRGIVCKDSSGEKKCSFSSASNIPSPTPIPLPTSSPTPVPPTPTNTPPPTPFPTATSTPLPSGVPTPTLTPAKLHALGDANNDGKINIFDFNAWLAEFNGTSNQQTADFDGTNGVDIIDFNIWLRSFNDPELPH